MTYTLSAGWQSTPRDVVDERRSAREPPPFGRWRVAAEWVRGVALAGAVVASLLLTGPGAAASGDRTFDSPTRNLGCSYFARPPATSYAAAGMTGAGPYCVALRHGPSGTTWEAHLPTALSSDTGERCASAG